MKFLCNFCKTLACSLLHIIEKPSLLAFTFSMTVKDCVSLRMSINQGGGGLAGIRGKSPSSLERLFLEFYMKCDENS